MKSLAFGYDLSNKLEYLPCNLGAIILVTFPHVLQPFFQVGCLLQQVDPLEPFHTVFDASRLQSHQLLSLNTKSFSFLAVRESVPGRAGGSGRAIERSELIGVYGRCIINRGPLAARRARRCRRFQFVKVAVGLIVRARRNRR